MTTTDTTEFRTGYAALVGEPNVGKSTLLNAILGQKISIVTDKPQTTRHKIAGILSEAHSQIVFLDTPGIIKPTYLLQEVMMQFAASALEDADVILLLVDAEKLKDSGYTKNTDALEKVAVHKKPTFLVINKIDTVEKGDVLDMIAHLHGMYPFDEVFPISALKNYGTRELVEGIVRRLPVHPAFYPDDIASEAPEKFFVSELIREKIFQRYSKEIPYSTTVDIIEFKERSVKKHFISADIYVERQSQKGILIGKQGSALKAIGTAARHAIEAFLDRPVYLEIHVQVRKAWRKDPQQIRRLGYE
jgi:GTP-binding protein Era